MKKNVQPQQNSNPVLNEALERAVAYIDGCENTTNAFNQVAGDLLRQGIPGPINVVRQQRRLIRAARAVLGE